MKRDPRVRSDGKCANKCGKPLRTTPPKTMPKALRGMFLEALAGDVFCSTACCREYHGVPLSQPISEPPAKRVRTYEDPDRTRERRRKIRSGEIKINTHSAAGYRSGCRCDECRSKFRVWQKARRQAGRR